MVNKELLTIRTIRELFPAAAASFEKSPALCMTTESGVDEISFKDYVNEIQNLSVSVVRQFGTGKIIVLPGNLSKEWLMIFFAVLYSGNIAAPVDLSNSSDETLKKVAKLRPDAIFTENQFPSVREKFKRYFNNSFYGTIEEWYSLAVKEGIYTDDTVLGCEQHPDDTAVLVFTSGTTGNNKVVELTHRNLCADGILAGIYLSASHSVGARVLSALPVFHLYGITAPLISGLIRGFCLCLGGGAWTLRKDIQRYQPEILLVVPQIIYSFGKKFLPESGTIKTEEEKALWIENVRNFFGKGLKCVITGGAPIDPVYKSFFDGFGVYLMNGYGITECSPIVSCDAPLYHKNGAIGKTGIEAKLCQVKIDNGEICVKGEIVSPGYWKEPELNQLVYTDGWFKTGDLGSLDEEGYLYLTGRKKNILILPDGNNISLEEMERKLECCPEVDAALVSGRIEKDTTYIEAIIYSNPENSKSCEKTKMAVEEWIRRMNELSPRYKRIAEFRITNEPFERTALGKIKKYKYL